MSYARIVLDAFHPTAMNKGLYAIVTSDNQLSIVIARVPSFVRDQLTGRA